MSFALDRAMLTLHGLLKYGFCDKSGKFWSGLQPEARLLLWQSGQYVKSSLKNSA